MMAKVLLAEDTRTLRQCYTWGLEDEGYEVKAVATADELKTSATDADVLVVDARLPSHEKMEGIASIGELLRENRIAARVPIIFISILDADDSWVVDKLQRSGIPPDRYIWLLKPFEVELLARRIELSLSQRAKLNP